MTAAAAAGCLFRRRRRDKKHAAVLEAAGRVEEARGRHAARKNRGKATWQRAVADIQSKVRSKILTKRFVVR